MSSIDRLKILGIRSFGPDKNDEANVHFSSPLTLILGQNGCGKTTIIEALKYATCGELPGGTDGGSGFVFDPKLAHTNEVKGHILLKCKNIKGEVKQVKRVVRVVQKFKKLTFNSVDNTFTNGEGKNAESISGRCVDINDVVCQSLGVSRAILTNVIFCHQEDSLWPLEKGKVIKEKFDAIFGITEYNTCLEYLRRLGKEYEEKKGLYKKDVEYTRKFWVETLEKRKKLDGYNASLIVIQDRIREVDDKLKPMLEKISDITFRETNFAEFKSKITDQKNRKLILLESIEEIKNDIKEKFVGNKETLLKKIESFEHNLRETETELTELLSQRNDLETEESRTQKEYDSLNMLYGNMQGEERAYDRKIRTRRDQLKFLTCQLGIRFNEAKIEEVFESLEYKERELHDELKKMQEEFKDVEKTLQSSIDQIRERKAILNQDLKSKEQKMFDNEQQMKKVELEIEEVERSNNKLNTIEKDLEIVNNQLKDMDTTFNVQECKNKLEIIEDDIKVLKTQNRALEKEEKELRLVESEITNVNNLKKRLNKLQDDFDALEIKNHGVFLQLLAIVPESNFKSRIELRIGNLTEEILSIENIINQKDRALSALREQKKNLSEQLRQKNLKLSRDEERIEECCGQKSIQEHYEELIKLLKDANDRKGTAASSEHMFGKYLQQLDKEHPMCPVCKREFNNKEETIEILNDLREKMKGFPSKLRQAEDDIRRYTDEQKKVAGFLPLQENINCLKNEEIPRLRKEIQNVDTRIREIENELEIYRNNIERPKSDKEDAMKVLSDAILMDQYANEIQILESNIKELEFNLPSSISTRSLQKVSEELEHTSGQLENLRKTFSSEQKAFTSFNENKNKLFNLQAELTSQKFNISGIAHKREILAERLEEIKKLRISIENELKKTQQQVAPLSDDLNELCLSLSKTRAQHELLLENKRSEFNEMGNKIENVKSLHREINKYKNDGSAEKLIKLRTEMNEKCQYRDNLKCQKNELDKKIEEVKQFQNGRELKKRDLINNMKLMNKEEELQITETKIKELMGEISVVNFDQLNAEKKDLLVQTQQLERLKATAQGERSQMNQRILEAEKELKQDDYRNAEGNYRKSSVELSITTKAIDDLTLYQKAMDWAMIHFHKERMKMINAIVRELWRTIYRGNDIDWIEIKTDESTGTTGKRSYNYKVVQIKSGIELDMPGRCSAGQKVLACLIIRMALAETFSKNCGILALDEPTTNLDRDNIESLSEALAEIVERRSLQRNFQLIVITHDEEFLRKLMRVEKVDGYLEVKRDDRGRSRVTEIKVL